MGQILHGSARTTEAVRRTIVNQHSKFTTYQHPKVSSLEVAQ